MPDVKIYSSTFALSRYGGVDRHHYHHRHRHHFDQVDLRYRGRRPPPPPSPQRRDSLSSLEEAEVTPDRAQMEGGGKVKKFQNFRQVEKSLLQSQRCHYTETCDLCKSGDTFQDHLICRVTIANDDDEDESESSEGTPSLSETEEEDTERSPPVEKSRRSTPPSVPPRRRRGPPPPPPEPHHEVGRPQQQKRIPVKERLGTKRIMPPTPSPPPPQRTQLGSRRRLDKIHTETLNLLTFKKLCDNLA